MTGGVSISHSFAQTNPAVGINTLNPKGPFHVDAKGNTQGTSNVSDDVFVDKNGNLGIGTIEPTAKVHIKTDKIGKGLRISDQSESAGSMLMVLDNTGVVNWVPKPFTVREASINTEVVMNSPHANNHYEISKQGQGLKLPPGVWMIMAKYLIFTNGGDEGKMFWTYLHDLDDVKGLPEGTDRLKDKRTPCLYPNDNVATNCNNNFNKNWYLASSGIGGDPASYALSAVGVYPEAKPYGYTTPTINYIAVIDSEGKKPGDPGYEHEIVLTFSTSSNTNMRSMNGIMNAGNGGTELPIGVYFFAIRLDANYGN